MSLRNVIVLMVFLYVHVTAEVLVTLPNGTIRGRIEYSSRNISFYAFQEIPFAKPPVGELRFREPQPAEPWEGVLDATKNTKICYQQTTDNVNLTLMQNEDCLYLNVYTPTYPKTNASLPVMFYIYGGGFVNGFAIFDTWGPHYFMEHEVIVVTANYRLGPFGFLTTGDLVIPGNYGLKDQLLALKWVNQNIIYFGGDPEKVTIFGQSAGAASVNYHYMSKKSTGLFRAGIAESGSIFSPWAYQEDYKKIAYDLASYVDSTFSRSSNSKELLTFLRNVSASDLAKAASSFPSQMLDDQIVQGFLFTPTIEPKHDDAFITETMYEAVEKGHINRAPMMMGICSEEAIYRAIDLSSFKLLAEKLDNDATLLVNKNMHLTDPVQIQAAGEAIHKFYTDGAFADNLGKAVRFYSDTSFNRGMIRYAELQSRFGFIFFYQFSYEGDLIEDRPTIVDAKRVSHGDDLRYLWAFGNWSVMDLQTPRDILMFERYLTLFTNFAKYTDPTPKKTTLFENIYWPVVIPHSFNYLDINENLTTPDNTPKYDIYQNWVNLYRRMAVKPYTTF